MPLTLIVFIALALTTVPVTSSHNHDTTRMNDVQDRAIGPRADSSVTQTTPRHATVQYQYVADTNTPAPYSRTAVIDSLAPTYHPSQLPTSSNHQALVTIIVAFVVALVGLCTVASMIFFLVRYYMRRAAVRRRRQASWILRTGQWSTEAKQAEAHGTRTGCSDTSSFSAYPYPLSEHF